MSDKEESAPVVAPAAKGDTTNTETVPVKEPKMDASKAAAEEKSEEAVKPAKQEEAIKKEASQPANEPSKEPTVTEPEPVKAEKDDNDIEMEDAPNSKAPAESSSRNEKADESETVIPATTTLKTKGSASRRKSTGGADKGKTLNKKASKAQILHIDAQPGDHYFIKLKGFPQWPCIICDEDMLPQALLKTRPVSAARADGGYREDFADGGKNAPNRTFPIMYLATNEFGWVSNKDLIDLDFSTVTEQINPKMRKDLVLAHELAKQKNDLAYYKALLQQFQEELLQKREAAEAKAAAAASSKSSKKKGKASADEDVEMEDVDDELSAKKDKKRKNPDGAETPQRAESVKKLKIKLTQNSTPKPNGSSKGAKSGGEAKVSKKGKKPKEESEERVQTPAAPELSASEKYERKKKEVLFLRHKLQKGLLTRDQQPKEDEMKLMSDYLLKLEGFPDLETEIIKTTKINKVLKAMLKLDNIPKEEEYEFKPRSQTLLDKWNVLLASEAIVPQSPPHRFDYNFKSGGGGETKSEANGVKKADTEEADVPKAEVKENEEGQDIAKKEQSPSEEKVTSKMEETSLSDEKPMKKEEASEEKPKLTEETKASRAVEAST